MLWLVTLVSIINLNATQNLNKKFEFERSKYAPDGFITQNFQIPKGLERAVDFWVDVYAKYDTNEIIIHDADNYIIYEPIDISDIENLTHFSREIKDEIIDNRVIRVQKKYREALKILHNNKQNVNELDPFLQSVYNKFMPINYENKFLDASRPGRMRAQKGQKSSFKKGLYYSSKYLPEMERIFKYHKIPVELARLPFVESYFDPRAVSSKNASGIWQFMKGTGKDYSMKVKHEYDERNDPIISTHAAAKFLKRNYNYLDKNWPLAVTAYNHGRNGLKKAIKKIGKNDLVSLIREYKSDRFGFASKNFYSEFLAALYLEKNYKNFFEEVAFAKISNYGVVVVLKPIKLSQLQLLLDVDKEELKTYNPAISHKIFVTDGIIPKGSQIKMPMGRFNRLLSRTEVVKDIADYVRFI